MTNRVSTILLPLLSLLMIGCSSGMSSTSSTSPTIPTNPTIGPSGTVVLPNGSAGVAVVHIEDSTGNLLATPVLSNVATSFPATVVAEPPDFSQGLVGGGTMVQEFDTATSSPSLATSVQVYTTGSVNALSVDADSSFSFVQMTSLVSLDTLCFTGGLHQTTGGNGLITGTEQYTSFVSSADGTLGAAFGPSGLQVWGLQPIVNPHSISETPEYTATTPTTTITGRGAMAINPASPTQVLLGVGNVLLAEGGFSGAGGFVNAEHPYTAQVSIPGGATITSVAYLSGGTTAVVATTLGLYTVTIKDTGTQITLTLASSTPTDPTYTGSDSKTYAVDHAQSIALTRDGKYLVALTDQPVPSAGTLLVLPISSAGVVGTVSAQVNGLLATAGVDSVFAY